MKQARCGWGRGSPEILPRRTRTARRKNMLPAPGVCRPAMYLGPLRFAARQEPRPPRFLPMAAASGHLMLHLQASLEGATRARLRVLRALRGESSFFSSLFIVRCPFLCISHSALSILHSALVAAGGRVVPFCALCGHSSERPAESSRPGPPRRITKKAERFSLTSFFYVVSLAPLYGTTY